MAKVTIDYILQEPLMHNHVAGDISDLTSTLDPRYVNVSGDTMTGALVIGIDNATTNAVTTLLTLGATSTGTPTTGYGSRLLWNLETSTTAGQTAAILDVQWTDATHATRTSMVKLQSVTNGVTVPLLHNYRAPSSVGNNIFLGESAGNFTMSPAGGSTGLASYNVGVGVGSLLSLTTGYANLAVGAGALQANTTGAGNVAIGNNALASNQTGSESMAIGSNALISNTASGNVAIGANALYANTTGANNVAIGKQALDSNVDGTANMAIGDSALQANVSGYYNVGVGVNALLQSTGWFNVGLGLTALGGVTGGSANVGVGYNTLYNTGNGNYSIGIGHMAGMYETSGQSVYIDSLDRTNLAGGRANSLIYGTVNATRSSQTLNLNANVYIPEKLGVATGSVTSGYTLDVNGYLKASGIGITGGLVPTVNYPVAFQRVCTDISTYNYGIYNELVLLVSGASAQRYYGGLNTVTNVSSHNVSIITGVLFSASNGGTATTDFAYGVAGGIGTTNASATITNGYGIYAYAYSTAGTMTNYYGVYLPNPFGGGTFTNAYGVYVDDMTGATNNIAGYFGGEVRIKNVTLATATVNALQMMRLYRAQTGGVKYGNSMDILLGSYGTNVQSETRVDFKLAGGYTDTPDTVVMTLQGNGNVGIGTTAPAQKLHVVGTSFFDATSPTVRFRASNTRYRSDFDVTGTGVIWNAYDDYAAAYLPLTLDALTTVLGMQGSVGVGTSSPDTKFQVVGDAKFGEDTTNYLGLGTDGTLTLYGTAKYERHVQLDATTTGTPANQPTEVDFFTAGGLQFPTTGAKYAFVQWEVPDDWDGTDVYFEVDWFPDSGATSGTDAVRWTVEYRAVAIGEVINNGTSVTLDNGTGGDTADYAQYTTKHTRVTLAYNNANQPLTAQDHVYFKISRDTGVANDFAGTVTVMAFEVIYNSKGFPASN